MVTMTATVNVDGIDIEIKVECDGSVHGWAKACAEKLKKAVDAVKEEFGEKPGDGGQER
jgi:hypothetical protein